MRSVRAALLGVVAGAPSSALACAVCGGAQNDESTGVYLAMTGVLSLLPLALMGAVAFWLYRTAEAAERADEAQRVESVPPQVEH